MNKAKAQKREIKRYIKSRVEDGSRASIADAADSFFQSDLFGSDSLIESSARIAVKRVRECREKMAAALKAAMEF